MATLIGDGAHASDIWPTLRDDTTLPGPWFRVPHHKDLKPGQHSFGPLFIGINDPRLRAKVSCEMEWDDASWIHPDAHVYHSVIRHGAHINYGVYMTRTVVGPHTTISPGVTIAGGVSIGREVLIGAGATICDRVTIWEEATIGAGAVVLPETIIPPGETWVGVPARPR
jgi:acetyltransferase-like isoleucine patch superfamily enzyme